MKLELGTFYHETAEIHDYSVSILLNDVTFWQRINNASYSQSREGGGEGRRKRRKKSNRWNMKDFLLSSKQDLWYFTLPSCMLAVHTLPHDAKLQCLIYWKCELLLNSGKYES